MPFIPTTTLNESQEYTLPLVVRTALGAGISTTQTLCNMPSRAPGDMFITNFRVVTFVSITNDGSNFFTITLDKLTAANAATNIGSVSTAADAPTTWVQHVHAINQTVAGSTHVAFRIVATATGSPNAMVCGIEIIYRVP